MITILFVLGCIAMNWYVLAWIYFIGSIYHFLYQSEYKKIGTANAMAFAGLIKVDNRLMLHMLVNQNKIENLDFSKEVIQILSEDIWDEDGGYFFNYLCLSSMFYEICDGKNNYFSDYVDKKVDDIINNSDEAMASVEQIMKSSAYRYIPKEIVLFYHNYREFLLYVLMYYQMKKSRNRFAGLSNYIKYMLERIEHECVQANILSQSILTEKFEEYRGLYDKILNYEFEAEKSIFTGYETLPVWAYYRERFIQTFNGLKPDSEV